MIKEINAITPEYMKHRIEEETERLIISLQAQEELTMNEHIKVEKLNNIINELEKWCNEEMYADDQLYEKVLNKLQELKGSDKE